ncbi:hypothetical protein AB0E52_09110 [Micrococcus luteus]|uniref:hypothetical protein n=1 Tax=Micrococcaceae TaxID=1268 RepID=UPI0033281484
MSDLDPTPVQSRRRVWSFYAGAGAAALLGLALLGPALTGQPTLPAPAASSTAAVATPAAPASAPTPTASDARETSQEKTPSSTASASGKPQVSPSSTSAARSAQIEVEQAAAERAVAGLTVDQKAQAEQVAREFVIAANERSWQTNRQQWVKELASTAAEEVIAEVNQDQDWNSDVAGRFVAGKSTTTAEVAQAKAQTVADGQIEVAVTVATQTSSEDPWVGAPRAERSLVLVVDPAQKKVTEQIDMTPRGGL